MIVRTEPSRIHGPAHRARRFRASVEALDSRRLMASGVTALPLPVAGNAGIALPSTSADSLPGVPLIQLVGTTRASAVTVDWGDGSPIDVGRAAASTGVNLLFVSGPPHTYQQAGTYSITVSVLLDGDVTPTAYLDTASIAAGPPLTGQIPNADAFFEIFGTTNNSTLRAIGTTQPGVTVALSATSEVTGQTLVVGTTVADATGAWSLTTGPFVDGLYRLTATATNAAGAATSAPIRAGVTNLLVVDAGGPRVTGFRVTNARKGTFQVGFADPLGLFESRVTDTTQYSLSRITPAPRRGQPLSIAGLTSSATGAIPLPTLTPYGAPVLVTGTLRTGKKVGLADGTYALTIHAAGISSISNSALDGEYAGRFPSGNGAAGGDFRARFTVRNGRASAPVALTPARSTARAVPSKAAVKPHS